MSAMNTAMEHGKASAYETQALKDYKNEKNPRSAALREAYKKKTPLAAWETVTMSNVLHAVFMLYVDAVCCVSMLCVVVSLRILRAVEGVSAADQPTRPDRVQRGQQI